MMVWDNWNPLKDIRDEWCGSFNFWGKIKVFLFYSYVWVVFFGCVYQVFVPWSFGNDCFIAASTKNQDAIGFMIRQYDIIAAAWLLYVAKAKTTFANLRAFFAVLILSCFFAGFYEGQTLFLGPCGDTWMVLWYYWLGWPLLALICAYIEHFVERRSSTPAESQPLV